MHWMYLVLSITESTTQSYLRMVRNHINGIESFWNQAKRHTRKFNGLHKAHFGLFLKECEWPFNSPSSQAQLKQFKQWFKMYIGWLSRTAPNIFLIHLPTDIFEG